MTAARRGIDWQEAYARLERARRAIETGAELPPEDVQRILRNRARTLAKPLAEARTSADGLELLVFTLGGERYGIETRHVLEAVALRELAPVPCTPSFVLGVVNHRGRILPVLDLRRLFRLAAHGMTEGTRIVVVEAGGMTFGIFADAVAGTVRVGADEVAPPPATLTRDRRTFIQGVTSGMVAVLDLDALARDARILVNEEVS